MMAHRLWRAGADGACSLSSALLACGCASKPTAARAWRCCRLCPRLPSARPSRNNPSGARARARAVPLTRPPATPPYPPFVALALPPATQCPSSLHAGPGACTAGRGPPPLQHPPAWSLCKHGTCWTLQRGRWRCPPACDGRGPQLRGCAAVRAFVLGVALCLLAPWRHTRTRCFSWPWWVCSKRGVACALAALGRSSTRYPLRTALQQIRFKSVRVAAATSAQRSAFWHGACRPPPRLPVCLPPPRLPLAHCQNAETGHCSGTTPKLPAACSEPARGRLTHAPLATP